MGYGGRSKAEAIDVAPNGAIDEEAVYHKNAHHLFIMKLHDEIEERAPTAAPARAFENKATREPRRGSPNASHRSVWAKRRR
jgi:hypothetical protein